MSAAHTLTSNKCDVIIYGNDRGFGADVVLRDIGKVLGIPTVVELLNLFPSKEMLPTAFIAPSHYALHHPSVQEAINSVDNERPEIIVIAPSVDLERFNYTQLTNEKLLKRNKEQIDSLNMCPSDVDECKIIDNHKKVFTIGFVARLAPEVFIYSVYFYIFFNNNYYYYYYYYSAEKSRFIPTISR
jgi:hypothetical protein